jgi:flagellar hook-basal body complex protein FliE
MNPIKINIHPQELSFPSLSPVAPNETPARSFKDTLGEFVNSVNDLQVKVGEVEKGFLSGEISDVHQVMIAVEEASVAFELLMEIRNKLLDSYQQIVRMPM